MANKPQIENEDNPNLLSDLANIGKQPQSTASADNPLVGLSVSEVDKRISAMSHDELVAIIKRCNAVLGGAALATPKEIAEAVKLRLAHFALSAEIKDALVAIDKYLNRVEGLPVQKEAMDLTVNNTNYNFGLPDDVLESMLLRYKRKRELSQQQLVIENHAES